MDGSCELERRLIGEQPGLEVKTDQNGRTVIRGYAAVFESESQDLGGFVEIVERGAFDDVMKSNPDVFGKYNHTQVIGRTSSGTMRLMVDDRGLRYEIDPPKSAEAVVELISRGDVRGSSFAFRSNPKDESWQRDAGGRMIRRIKKFSFLGDAGPVDTPAYLATETYVSKRALEMAACDTRAAADSIAVGDFVSWDSSGGMARGKITKIVDDGRIDVPDSDFGVTGTPDNPAVLIRVYSKEGDGWMPGDKIVGHRASTLTKIDDLMPPSTSGQRSLSLKPTAGMAAAAKRGLRLHEEGKSGDGLKPETVARANRLARREEMNDDWVREMNAWFARHASDRRPGWDKPGAETPGFVAWLLWGGNAARNFAARKVAAMDRQEGRAIDTAVDPAVSMEDYSDENTDLSANNVALLQATEAIADQMGMWPQEGPNGAHYMAESPFVDSGMRCAHCLMYEGGGACEVVEGEIAPEGVCKLWVIPASKLAMRSEPKPEDFQASIASLKATMLRTHLHAK